jgi:signal transduction histidine kinase
LKDDFMALNFRCCLILLILLCDSFSCAAASPPLALHSGIESFPLAGHIDILEDKSGKLTFAEVSIAARNGMFKPDKRAMPNFGITNNVYWVRFSIRKEAPVTPHWLLELDFPHMDYLDLYAPRDGGGYELMQAGDMRPMSVRKFSHRNPVFPVSIDAPESTFYLRVDARGRTMMPLTLRTPEAFSRMDNHRGLIDGGYFGAMLVMVAFNLFIFLTLRDRNYLYYVLDMLCIALYVFFSKGLMIEFVSGGLPSVNQYSYTLIVPALLTGIVFARSFLELDKNAPVIDLILKIILLLGLLSIPAVFVVSPEVWKSAVTVLTACSSITGMIATLVCLRQGFHPARYYLAARAFRAFGTLSVVLVMHNILPMNILSPFSVQLTSILEMVFLSFALSDRINTMRREKEEAEAEALRSSQLAVLGELAAGVAHEINTPLNTIINSAQLLLEDDNQEDLAHDVAVIKDQSRRIASIANSLLFFARRPAQDKVPIAVAGLVQLTLDMFGAKLRKENITLTIKTPSDLRDVLVHPQQIEQVFINILTNALHALDEKHGNAPGSKTLDITAAEIIINDRHFVRVAFLDNGAGIPANLLDSVTKSFVTTKKSGNGLGLSISARIINEHGGAIGIASRAGEFTEVSLNLPAAENNLSVTAG